MDGQNFENENNVTVDTTATEVSSTAEPAQQTPAAEQPANNYQDYTTNVQPVVLSVQYLPISRVRPDWQRVD